MAKSRYVSGVDCDDLCGHDDVDRPDELGLSQAGRWGWTSVATLACLVAGVLLLLVFVRFELRQSSSLIACDIFRHLGFSADNVVMGLAYASFLPFFSSPRSTPRSCSATTRVRSGPTSSSSSSASLLPYNSAAGSSIAVAPDRPPSLDRLPAPDRREDRRLDQHRRRDDAAKAARCFRCLHRDRGRLRDATRVVDLAMAGIMAAELPCRGASDGARHSGRGQRSGRSVGHL